MIPVDSISILNFVHKDLAERLGLENRRIEPFEARVANGVNGCQVSYFTKKLSWRSKGLS